MDCSPPGSSVHGDIPGNNTVVGCHAFLQGSSQPRDEAYVPALQADSLPSEPPGKPTYIFVQVYNSVLRVIPEM